MCAFYIFFFQYSFSVVSVPFAISPLSVMILFSGKTCYRQPERVVSKSYCNTCEFWCDAVYKRNNLRELLIQNFWQVWWRYLWWWTMWHIKLFPGTWLFEMHNFYAVCFWIFSDCIWCSDHCKSFLSAAKWFFELFVRLANRNFPNWIFSGMVQRNVERSKYRTLAKTQPYYTDSSRTNVWFWHINQNKTACITIPL